MKNNLKVLALLVIIFNIACAKTANTKEEDNHHTPISSLGKRLHVIPQGSHYCDGNIYTSINLSKLNFKVKFDSSAIYQTASPSIQVDINKLYGFSDNNNLHHNYSARFGWRWRNNELQIFTYIYNAGIVSYQRIGTAQIGVEETYSIEVANNSYIFSFQEQTTIMPRESTTTTAIGYKLYPYFGGNETAPHNIKIWIEEF